MLHNPGTGGASPVAAVVVYAEDRRRFPRRKLLWPATVIVHGARHTGIILDLSVSGARLKFDRPLTTGEELSLIVRECDAVDAAVVWQHHGEIGLRFIGPDAAVSQLGTTIS